MCEEVEGNAIEQNEIEQDIENGKLLLATKGGHTHIHTLMHAQRMISNRAENEEYILHAPHGLLCLPPFL